MAERRRYTHRQKATAVIAATVSSVAAAAEESGIPRTTIAYWMDEPEFVALRQKTREEWAEETRTLAIKVLGEIRRRLPEFEPRDLSVLFGVLTDKGQLLSGAPTSRTETKALTAGLDDHEKAALRTVIDHALEEVEA